MEEEVSHGSGKKRVYEPGDSGRCSKVASKKKYSKKRKFHGNQSTTKLPNQKLQKRSPASLKKVKSIRNLSCRSMSEGYRLFDMSILSTLISSLACPECYECTFFIDEQYEKRKGLASCVSVNCSSCDYINGSYTSQTICTSKIQGAKPMEINYRAVYAARTVGQGYSGLEKLCGMLNLPRPMTCKNFDTISRNLGESAKETA